jgi:hypothetical protein
MIFSLDVRRARKGDCLLVHFGTKEKPGLIMIDGGPKDVYKPQLKPRLEQIRAARKLANQDSLPVDVLMVSHVDDDHIQGILDLTKEERIAKDAHRPRMLNVQSFWHNGFDDIIGHEPTELTASFKTHFGPAAVSGGGELDDGLIAEIEDKSAEDEEVVGSSLKVLASIEQGFRLRGDSEALGYPRNREFGGKLIMAQPEGKTASVGNGLKLTVIGPMQPELKDLFEKHQQWLEQLKKQGKAPADALAAYVDKSIPNLSSIVVLAESDGKSLLLTGDARGDKVLEGLQMVGRLEAGKTSKMNLDLVKVPHHGSANNLAEDFFERLVAKHYVFSGNGEHGNPERETMGMLLAARGHGDYQIHLTYPVDEIDIEREKDWNKERNKEIARKAKKIRQEWSPQTNSLGAFLDDNPEFKKQIRVVEAGKAHVINLSDPLNSAWSALET